MRKRRTKEQPEREDRILFEIAVDAYNETERAMAWYYHLQEKLKVPFHAKLIAATSSSQLQPGQHVKVLGLAAEDDCMKEIFVKTIADGARYAIPLTNLECLSNDQETLEAVSDWHYWVNRGYEY